MLPSRRIGIGPTIGVATMAQPTYQDSLNENRQMHQRVAELEAQVNKLTQLLEQPSSNNS